MALISKYSLNGNANDLVGSNNGTATNITWVDGNMNQSASCNGTSSYIIIPDTTATRLTTFTLSMLIKLNGTIASEQIPIRKDTISTRHLWGFTIPSGSSSISSQVYNGTNYLSSGYSLTLGKRTHVVMTVTTGVMKFYVDGVQYGSDVSIGTFTAPTSDIYISRDATAPANYFNGCVDELEIDNTVWTESDIKNKYLYFNGFM